MRLIEQGDRPFRHWIFDQAIPGPFAQDIFAELTTFANDPHYRANMYKYDNVFEKKFAQDKLAYLGPNARAWLMMSLSSGFIGMMEEITGIQGLIGDPWFRGGGFHLHTKGGILKPHVDFTLHPKLKLVRRLNFIVYLNKNYDPEWGSQLEFWNKEMTVCEKKINPGYNIGVLFETPDAPHGFSTQWNAPNDIKRKSLAIYFYSAPTEEDLRKDHKSTQFLRIPDEPHSDEIEALRSKRNQGRLATNVEDT